MKWLGIVAKHHKEYVSIVNGFGEHFYAEDIVQETYLRILKYCKPEAIITNGNVNKSYVYFVLRNMYIDFRKVQSEAPEGKHRRNRTTRRRSVQRRKTRMLRRNNKASKQRSRRVALVRQNAI
jgi:DNA-directed RNA polymerase specialized sigma24 family protein